jgi:cytochrome c biogenesis protein CcdA
MTAIDLVFGLLAGIVSCLTPEALPLLPLLVAAAGAASRASVIAPAIGLGVAVILTGALAASFGALFGLEAIWLRRVVCVLLILLGVILMRVSLVERFSMLTGGEGGLSQEGGAYVGAARRFLLALLVGANWDPVPGPTLGKASLMAADAQNYPLAFGILFVFGVGAAMPWIALGRVIRLPIRVIAPRLLDGMLGKRLLGLTLLAVAIVGISGQDVTLARLLDQVSPVWAHKLAITF